MEPIYLKTARAMLGTHEFAGAKDNPALMKLYRTIGHSWVLHDEVHWCSAFVDYHLEINGYENPRSLRARDNLVIAQKVKLADAQPGDVVIFSRGSNPAYGHVAFLLRVIGKTHVEVIGGNQYKKGTGGAVTIARYPVGKIVGIRRPKKVRAVKVATLADVVALKALSKTKPPKVTPEDMVLETGATGPLVRELQRVLHAKGYPCGEVDGEFGSGTAQAVMALKLENGLDTTNPDISIAQARAAKQNPLIEKRKDWKLKDLKETTEVAGGSALKQIAGVTAGVAAVAETESQFGYLEKAQGYLDQANMFRFMIEGVQGLLDFAIGNPLVLLGSAGAGVWLIAKRIQKSRLREERLGINRSA